MLLHDFLFPSLIGWSMAKAATKARPNQQLYEAVENGNFEEIEHLLSLHPDIDVNWKNNEKV